MIQDKEFRRHLKEPRRSISLRPSALIRPFTGTMKFLFEDYDRRYAAPFVILFVIFIVFMSLTVLVANRARMDYWANTMTHAYPQIAQVENGSDGKPLHRSVLDLTISEFNATNNVGYLVFFAIIFRSFLKTIWYDHNRKPQVIKI